MCLILLYSSLNNNMLNYYKELLEKWKNNMVVYQKNGRIY
jgi:hypothetical protein